MNNLLLLRLSQLILRIPKIVLFLRDEFHSHFVNFVLLLKSTLVIRKVIFDRWVVLAPAQDFIHSWVLISQVCFFAIKNGTILKFIKIVGKHLVLHLSFLNVGLTFVRWFDALVALTCEHLSYLSCLIVTLRELLSGSRRKSFIHVGGYLSEFCF